MNYDVVGDGEQFLMIERDNTEGMSNYLNVVHVPSGDQAGQVSTDGPLVS